MNELTATEEYVKSFFPGKSPGTVKAYASDLETFSSYLGTGTVEEALELLFALPLNRANLLVMHYKAEIDDSGIKVSSINRKLSALRSIVKEANRRDIVPWILEINNEKVVLQESSNHLDRSIILKLFTISQTQKNPAKAARDFAILRMIYDLALKRSTIAKLQLSDINSNNKTVCIQSNNGKVFRIKSIPNVTMKVINAWIYQRGTEPGPFFLNLDRAGKGEGISSTSVYRIVQKLGMDLGLKITPDDIRKAAIVEAVTKAENLGMEDHEILAFTDHKQVSSLNRYKKQQMRSQLELSTMISKC